METRPRLRVSYSRLEKPGIKLRTPGYKAKRDNYIHGYLHLIVEYHLSPLTIMGRMGKRNRVENRGKTTRGESTRGGGGGGKILGAKRLVTVLGWTPSLQENKSTSRANLVLRKTFMFGYSIQDSNRTT